jgi:hypothetical protein
MSKTLTLSLLLLWLVLAVFAGYALWAFEPQGMAKWLLYVVAVPPLYLVFSAAGDLLGEAFARLPGIRHGNQFVERRTTGPSTSGLRILWYLFTILLLIGIVVGLTWLYRTQSQVV